MSSTLESKPDVEFSGNAPKQNTLTPTSIQKVQQKSKKDVKTPTPNPESKNQNKKPDGAQQKAKADKGSQNQNQNKQVKDIRPPSSTANPLLPFSSLMTYRYHDNPRLVCVFLYYLYLIHSFIHLAFSSPPTSFPSPLYYLFFPLDLSLYPPSVS